MPLFHFLVRAFDGQDGITIRAEIRETHRAHLRRPSPDCRCILGGPLRNDQGEMIGTALVFEASSRTAVEQFMADDPYVKARLFVRLETDVWTIGLGTIDTSDQPSTGSARTLR